MKKWIIFFATFFLIVLICFFSYVYLYRAEFTSYALSRLYGTSVNTSKIRVTGSKLDLFDFTIYNDIKYTMQPALSVAKVVVKITPKQMFKAIFGISPIEISKVKFVDPLVAIEFMDTNNWAELLQHVANNVDASRQARRYKIQTVTLFDIAVEMKNKAVQKHTIRPAPINKITFKAKNETDSLPLDSYIFWATKDSLMAIGNEIGQPEFVQAIEAISCSKAKNNPFTK